MLQKKIGNEDAVITYSIWQARKNFKYRNYYKYSDDAMMPNIQEYKKSCFVSSKYVYKRFTQIF